MARNNITPIRSVTPIPKRNLDRIFDPRPNLNDTFAESLQRPDYAPPSLLERLADFFKSDRGISFMWGFYSGAMLTVAAAFVWGLA